MLGEFGGLGGAIGTNDLEDDFGGAAHGCELDVIGLKGKTGRCRKGLRMRRKIVNRGGEDGRRDASNTVCGGTPQPLLRSFAQGAFVFHWRRIEDSGSAGHGILGNSHGNQVLLQKDLAGCDGWHGYNVSIWISLRNATRAIAVKRRLVSR